MRGTVAQVDAVEPLHFPNNGLFHVFTKQLVQKSHGERNVRKSFGHWPIYDVWLHAHADLGDVHPSHFCDGLQKFGSTSCDQGSVEYQLNTIKY